LAFSADERRRYIADTRQEPSHIRVFDVTDAGGAVFAECTAGRFDGAGPVTKLLVRLLAQTPEQGALPTLYAAVVDLPGASFIGPSRLMHMRGTPQLIKRSAAAQNPELAARLWTLSEQLTGLRSPLRQHPPSGDNPLHDSGDATRALRLFPGRRVPPAAR
jgi:hypothetical protein